MRTTKLKTIAIAGALALALVACKKDKGGGGEGGGGGGGGGTTAPPVALSPLDISAGGEDFAGLSVKAPAGATAKESFGNVEVTSGDGFTLEIHSGAADIASLKTEIKANDINKFKKFHTETADELVYESEVMGKTQVHFVANVKVGDKAFNCENVKGGKDKTLAETQVMVTSCKSLAAAGGGGGGAAPAPAGSGEPAPAGSGSGSGS
jgi:hypothetical protein